jgi:hypothetical protein
VPRASWRSPGGPGRILIFLIVLIVLTAPDRLLTGPYHPDAILTGPYHPNAILTGPYHPDAILTGPYHPDAILTGSSYHGAFLAGSEPSSWKSNSPTSNRA